MDPISKEQSGKSANRRKQPSGPKKTAHLFQPGQSGNPSGRPHKRPITRIFEELFDCVADREAIKASIRATMTSKGMAGVLLVREAAERIEGKVSEQVEMNVTGKVALSELISERRKRKEK